MNETLWFLVFVSWPAGCGVALWWFAKYCKAARQPPKTETRGGKPQSPAAGMAAATGPRLAAGNALVFCFLCSLGFLGGEIYYRFIYDTTDSFNYTKVSRRWQARHYQKNAQTVRDNVNYQLRIPPVKRRITFIGDSFTAGHGVKNVEDRFANRIRRANPPWDVQVMAAPGQETGEEAKLLEQLIGQGCQLDQVVLVYCLNDLSDIVPESKAMAARIYGDSQKQNWLVRNSYFVNLFYYRWKAWRDPDISNYYHYLLAAYRGPLWEQQQRRLRAIRDRVEANGGHLLVVTFPFLHVALDDTYEYRFVHERLAALWRELKVPHLDLLTVYQGLPPRTLVVNRCDAHPNERAHELAAHAIQKFLEANISARSGFPARTE